MGFDDNVEFENVSVEKVHDAAVLCIIEGKKHWIPFSQIIDDESEITKDSSRGDEGLLVVTEWICVEKGLV